MPSIVVPRGAERNDAHIPNDASWHMLANIDMMFYVVEYMREELSSIAWDGLRRFGPGFILLTIGPALIDAWRTAWKSDTPFAGDDITAQYVPVNSLREMDTDFLNWFAVAARQAQQYSGTKDMVLAAILPHEDTSGYCEQWMALERLAGIDIDMVNRCLAVDRSILNQIPNVYSYARFAASGEIRHEINLVPYHLMHIRRISDEIRERGLHAAMLCIEGPGTGEILVGGPIEGFIYLVRRGDEVKIGKTIDLRQRLKQLKSVFAIEGLVHYILTDDVTRAERAIHKWMAPYRMSGEWFRLPPEKEELIRYILCLYMHGRQNAIETPEEDRGWVRISQETASRVDCTYDT